MKSVRIRMKHFCNRLGPYISNLVKPGLFFSNIIMNGPNRHSGYLYYIDGYKKWNRSSQTTVIDIKITALTMQLNGIGLIRRKFVVCPQSSILHPKSTKLGKLGIFNSLEIA